MFISSGRSGAIRIAFVTPHFGHVLGGAEINDFKLGRALQKQGHTVSYYFIHDNEKPLTHNACIIGNAHPVDMRYWYSLACRAPWLAGKVLRHLFEEYFLGRLLAQHRDSLREQDLILITGRPVLSRIARYVPGRVVRAERGISNPRYRKMFSWSDGVIFWGGCEEGHWAMDMPGLKSLALKPAVDKTQFYQKRPNRQIRKLMTGGRERPVITYTGRLDPIHQVDQILRACIALKNEGLDFSLNIIGDGFMTAQINALAADELPVDMYHFHGRKPSDAVADYLRATDIFIINPRLTNHPIAMMEAVACGAFVMSPELGRAPEILEKSGGYGRLFLPNDTADMTRALGDVIRQGAYKAKPGKAKPQFDSWDDNARRILDWYAQDLAPTAVREKAA